MKRTGSMIAIVILTVFALITLFMSTSVIFNLFGIREKEGNYVLFVVISNFIAGFLYLISAYGLYTQKAWSTKLLILTTAILAISFIGLLYHVNAGGIYEPKTIKAMIFRTSFTALFALLSKPILKTIKN